ncbi:neprilysin-11-like [Amblyomma americanum]
MVYATTGEVCPQNGTTSRWHSLGEALRAGLSSYSGTSGRGRGVGRWSRRGREWRRYDYGEEVRVSLDWAADPCEDFYRFVCGRWSRSHPGLSNEFVRLHTDLLSAAIEKLAQSRQRNTRNISVVEYAGEALRYCLTTYVLKLHDLTPFYTVLQGFPFQWPYVEPGVRFDILDFGVSLALGWGLPVLFDLEVTTDLRTDNMTILRVSRSELLLDWIGQWFNKGGPSLWFTGLPRTFDPFVDYKFLASRVVEPSVEALILLLSKKNNDEVPKPAYVRFRDVEYLTRSQITSERWVDTINRHLPDGVELGLDSEMHLLDEALVQNIGEFVNFFESSNKEDGVAVLAGWVLANHIAPALSYKVFKGYDNAVPMAVYHCLQLVSDMAPYPLNWFLTEQTVSPVDWNATWALLADVHHAMAQYFDWMDAFSRERALRRLNIIRHVVAYPSVDSTRETVERRFAYLRETVRSPFGLGYIHTKRRQREQRNMLLKASMARQDDDWFTVPLVNAVFLPYYHIVFIPTSMMLPPFLTPQYPAASFGGLGHVLAHEESHAFDVEGAPADADGLYRRWYSAPTQSRLEDRKRCLRSVYSVPSGGPWPTEGEDYADSLGLMVAATAFKQRLSPHAPSGLAPFTNEQLFYVSSCFKWCNSQSGPNADKDPRTVHSDMYKRCNAPLLVEENFLAAFNCTSGAAMRPRQKCAFS